MRAPTRAAHRASPGERTTMNATTTRPAALAAAARAAETLEARRAAVLVRAHAMTRAAVAGTSYDYRATLAAALRIAWADATAPSALEAWAAMPDEEKVEALKAATLKAAARDIARTDAAGNYRPDRFAWARTPDGIIPAAVVAEIVNEACSRLIPYLTDPKHAGKPLAALMYQAVVIGAQKIDRAERRNARAIKYEDMPRNDADKRDGAERLAKIIDGADRAFNAERGIDPEAAAILKDTIEGLAADDVDRAILAGMINQYSAREIAEHVGMSHTAVNKRVAKIRTRYAEQNAETAEAYARAAAAYKLARKAEQDNREALAG